MAPKPEDGPRRVTRSKDLDLRVHLDFTVEGLDTFGVVLFESIEEEVDLKGCHIDGLRIEYLIILP